MIAHATIVVCLFAIGCLIAYIRDLRTQCTRYFDNWAWWERACKECRTEIGNLQRDAGEAIRQLHDSRTANKHLNDTLSLTRQQLAEEQEKACRYIELLNATEAKLADANLRIEAATENLCNQPIIEDEYPF